MRASRGWSLLVLVLALALLGPPGSASASDAGLRAVVQQDLAADKRLVAAGRKVSAPSSRTFAAYVRYLRRVTNYCTRLQRTVDRLYRRYEAQAPETAEAASGRTLALRGHRDLRSGARVSAAGLRRGIRQITQARTEGAYRRANRRMARVLEVQDKRLKRGDSRVRRGRKLIQTAPAPSAPAPAPGAPAPAPAPAPPAPAPPAPLLPGLPLLPPLLGG